MKFIAVFLLVALVAVAQAIEPLTTEQKDKLKAIHKECMASHPVDEEKLKKMKHGEFVDDIKVSEHILCMSKKMGFMTEEGKIDTENMKIKLRKNMTEEEVTKAMTECAFDKATPEETANELWKCWIKKSLKVAVVEEHH